MFAGWLTVRCGCLLVVVVFAKVFNFILGSISDGADPMVEWFTGARYQTQPFRLMY